MPLYTYQNPETGETKDIIQTMREEHVYEESGIKWLRIFAVPAAVVDGKMDAWSTQTFLDKTSKADTYGAMMDRSRDASEARAKQNGGIDPLRTAAEKEYSKARKGKKYIGKTSSPSDVGL